mmetsp:Transcript_38950/g.81864  ORF Transcript_38950/g.81864 Transcript_38950/m.81864 type:complete len:552 (-) Transcript_38950:197-1852(-)
MASLEIEACEAESSPIKGNDYDSFKNDESSTLPPELQMPDHDSSSSAGAGGSGGGRSGGCCCRMWDYQGVPEAKGYALLAMGRGVAVMSNLVVNAALLELASQAAGCLTGEEVKAIEEATGEDYECTNTIYGQNPLSLISNIAVVTGLLSAFFMPIIGVVLDFTPHRKLVGIVFCIVFICIQACQIAIGPKTWFPMAILQSIAGFCFSGMLMTSLAYLPEICEIVGQSRHTQYTARFTAKQFSVQALFLVLVGGLSFAFGISDDSVMTARMSQALNVCLVSILFGTGWRCYMPSRPSSRELPESTGTTRLRCCGIIAHGIRQNLRTLKSIIREYKKGLRWFMAAEVFAQSSVGALTTVSVVYLSSEVGLNATDITFFFLVVLIGTIPGSRVSAVLAKWSNPSSCWQASMIVLFVTMVIGAFTLGNAPNKYYSFIWGFFVGVCLGWFYPTENLFFSCILPKGSEAEIAGFRVICSMILSWLPPLIFSILVSNGVEAKWGMTFMASFVLVAALLLRLGAGSWEEMLAESGRSDLTTHVGDSDESSHLHGRKST